MNIPTWLDGESWAGWCEMRFRMKRVPFTERAQRIAIKQLEAWHAEGYDCAYILDESTLKGWRGLFVNERTPRATSIKNGRVVYSADDRAFYDKMRKEHPEMKWPV